MRIEIYGEGKAKIRNIENPSTILAVVGTAIASKDVIEIRIKK